MRKTIFLIVLLTFLFSALIDFSVNAHPGNTDAYGCHTCRTNCPSWGYYYGEYHCHTPKINIPPAPIYVPVYIPPPAPKFPEMTATWKWNPNDNRTFDLEVTLNDFNPTSYSAVISQYAGEDPGPLTDFTSNKFYFHNITTGKHYLNVKKSINGVWSTISYWTIEVPEWYPPPTPTYTPTPTIVPFILNNTSKDNPLINWLILGFIIYVTYRINKRFKLLNRLTSPLDLSKEEVFVNSLIVWVFCILSFLALLILSGGDFSGSFWALTILVLISVLLGVLAFIVMGYSFILIVLRKIILFFKNTF